MANKDDPSSTNKSQLRVVDDGQIQSVAKSLRESTNGTIVGTTPDKICWDELRKCLFFPIILAKTETSAKWMPDFPPPLIQSCLG